MSTICCAVYVHMCVGVYVCMCVVCTYVLRWVCFCEEMETQGFCGPCQAVAGDPGVVPPRYSHLLPHGGVLLSE